MILFEDSFKVHRGSMYENLLVSYGANLHIIKKKINKPLFGYYRFISADTSINETSVIG